MRVVVQRVRSARVEVAGATVGEIGPGLLVLASFNVTDGTVDLDWMCAKLVQLRIFADSTGLMNLSVQDTNGDILVVSQFTLFASTKKGNRPSWNRAATGTISQPLFDRFVTQLSSAISKPVPTGVFGIPMQVYLQNDGPITLILDSQRAE